MSVTFDDKDLRDFAKDLKAAPAALRKDVVQLLDKHADATAREARAAAPKDRPWLSTEQGLIVTKPGDLTRRIVSPLDPDGQSVGYRVEYGTSVQAPRPFLGPVIRETRQVFNQELLDTAVKVLS